MGVTEMRSGHVHLHLTAFLYGIALAVMPVPGQAQTVSATPSSSQACARLTMLNLPDLRIESGEAITPAPVWLPSELPAEVKPDSVKVQKPFCRVRGVIEEEIRFELWLPDPSDWTGRFYGAGNGGLAGFIRYNELARGIARGMAAMATNTGHLSTQQKWWRDHPRRIENLAFRGMHLATANAKAIATAYYGKSIQHSYFMGCSGGGMQGVNEASRYPADYDGVITGAHGISFPAVQARMMLGNKAYYTRNPEAYLDENDWKSIVSTAVAACDSQHGPRDGVVEHPEQCKFDLNKVSGLTPAKLLTARATFTPVVGSDGQVILDGMTPGAGRPSVGADEAIALFGEWLHNDRNWDLSSFDPAKDIPAADAALPGLSLAGADLSLFQQRGGKMIAFHGAADPVVPLAATIRYHQGIADRFGTRAADFDRLFVLPGVLHCSGGTMPDLIGGPGQADPAIIDREHDLLSAIISWVEEGKAPEHITATRATPGVDPATRKIEFYPLTSSGKP